jgi:flagellar basal-body rod protein FlgG
MFDALYVGATGLYAQQTHIDTVANNLANMHTTGFKKSRINFEDLMYRELSAQYLTQDGISHAVRSGSGTQVASSSKLFTQGELIQSESPYDLAINGEGFFPVLMNDGSSAYTRTGSLRVNAEGLLGLSNGLALHPPVSIPPESKELVIDRSGKVFVVLEGETSPTEVGQIELALFTSPAGLKPVGDNLYIATEQSGDAQLGNASEEGRGILAQKFLEGSNVRMVDELVNLMLAQRAFEANSKVVQASDEILGMINGLRRG